MTLTWSWEAEDYIGEKEPDVSPLVVCADACGVCGLPDTATNPVIFLCDACGNATHVACGLDTEPSGGYDRDPEENYWLCNVCLSDCEPADDDSMIDSTQLKSFDVPDDFDPFDNLYELP